MFARSLQCVAKGRAGRDRGSESPEFLPVCDDSTYKFFGVILTDPFHKAIRRNPDTQCGPDHRASPQARGGARADTCRQHEPGLGESHSRTTLSGVVAVQLGEGTVLPAPL